MNFQINFFNIFLQEFLTENIQFHSHKSVQKLFHNLLILFQIHWWVLNFMSTELKFWRELPMFKKDFL